MPGGTQLNSPELPPPSNSTGMPAQPPSAPSIDFHGSYSQKRPPPKASPAGVLVPVVAVLSFACFMIHCVQGKGRRGGTGGIGGRSDNEGITLIDTCMPKHRIANQLSDMQARRREQGLTSRSLQCVEEDEDML